MLLAVGAITALRVAYSVWWSPYELVADEAQYWDWSRHLNWSYYSKGPGVAWLIAFTTHMLGNAEWAIRLPAALSFAVVMLALAWLTADALADARIAGRAAVFVPFIVSLAPAYQLSSLLMTIDPPALACWALALVAAWRAYRQEAGAARPGLAPWLGLGTALGIGFLFKYTDVLLVPGLLLFAWMTRASVRWQRSWKRALSAGVVAIVLAMPVILWNARHGAAGAAHVLSYVDAPGGDQPDQGGGAWSWRTIAEYPVVQAAVIGPMLLLAIAGARPAGRERSAGGVEANLVRFLGCAAAPMLALFLLASARTRIEGNWPMAAFLSAVPMAATAVARGVSLRWWRATVVYGVLSLIVIHAPLGTAQLPMVGRWIPVHRFYGSRARIGSLGDDVRSFRARTADRGIVIALNHNEAGLLAYYLPGQPMVASAGAFLGERRSAYDFIAETDLSSARMTGRPALFVGGSPDVWRTACRCPDLTLVDSRGPLFETSAFAR